MEDSDEGVEDGMFVASPWAIPPKSEKWPKLKSSSWQDESPFEDACVSCSPAFLHLLALGDRASVLRVLCREC